MLVENPERDCKNCEYFITRWVGRGCVWCSNGIINIYKPRKSIFDSHTKDK